MGRGRAKAKQAKVARQLKYSGAGTDLEALRKELLGAAPSSDGEYAGEEDHGYADADDESDQFGPESYRAGGQR